MFLQTWRFSSRVSSAGCRGVEVDFNPMTHVDPKIKTNSECIVCYEHRVGWSRNSHFKISRNTKYLEEIIVNLKNETIHFRDIFVKFCEIISRNQK